MSKLIFATIDVTKIVKDLLYLGEKGTYLKLSIWQNDEPDKFGNDFSIQQTTGKDEPKIFLGNGKYYVPKEPTKSPDKLPNKSDDGSIDSLPF